MLLIIRLVFARDCVLDLHFDPFLPGIVSMTMMRLMNVRRTSAMTEHAFKQCARGEQIESFIISMGRKLPASMLGNPDCYMLCKENEDGRSVWIGYFFADECMNTTVLLDKEYNEIEFINCSGKLNGNEVEIDYIASYASVGFEVRLKHDFAWLKAV